MIIVSGHRRRVYFEDVFDLIDRLTRADRIPIPNSFLSEFLRATGLANVAYLAFNVPTGLSDRPLLSAAHAASWRKSHVQARRVDLEPVVRAGFGGIMPIDWRLLDRDDPVVRKLLGEALELDLGADGVSIPLRGRSGEYGLFSVCCPEDASSLLSPRHDLIRRLMVMSAIFHVSVRDAFKGESHVDVRLSDRELACLRLKARGIDDHEIGIALGARATAVRFWLEAARARLHAASVDDAIEEACQTGLIRVGVERPRSAIESAPTDLSSVDRRER
ncbi:autoinducer binding domain-containing protein [Methylocystis sp. L43]|nr:MULTISPECIES: autoinducer binding domain-containing protein [unclassified Methylocystis]MBG0797861.1 autoinducer binding domain-containing protein [Methylocystis sp. L43]MBG0805335.1 autoinducer binding domain-containing protein [Methylocystis sp. H15]